MPPQFANNGVDFGAIFRAQQQAAQGNGTAAQSAELAAMIAQLKQAIAQMVSAGQNRQGGGGQTPGGGGAPQYQPPTGDYGAGPYRTAQSSPGSFTAPTADASGNIYGYAPDSSQARALTGDANTNIMAPGQQPWTLNTMRSWWDQWLANPTPLYNANPQNLPGSLVLSPEEQARARQLNTAFGPDPSLAFGQNTGVRPGDTTPNAGMDQFAYLQSLLDAQRNGTYQMTNDPTRPFNDPLVQDELQRNIAQAMSVMEQNKQLYVKQMVDAINAGGTFDAARLKAAAELALAQYGSDHPYTKALAQAAGVPLTPGTPSQTPYGAATGLSGQALTDAAAAMLPKPAPTTVGQYTIPTDPAALAQFIATNQRYVDELTAAQQRGALTPQQQASLTAAQGKITAAKPPAPAPTPAVPPNETLATGGGAPISGPAVPPITQAPSSQYVIPTDPAAKAQYIATNQQYVTNLQNAAKTGTLSASQQNSLDTALAKLKAAGA